MYRTRQGTYKNCKTLPFRSIQSMDLERRRRGKKARVKGKNNHIASIHERN